MSILLNLKIFDNICPFKKSHWMIKNGGNGGGFERTP